MFTGREWLAEISLYDYRNRMYSPLLGRFMQPDPLGFLAGDVNIYRYCGNCSTSYKDPSGEFLIQAAAVALAAYAGWKIGHALGEFFQKVKKASDKQDQTTKARENMINDTSEESINNYQKDINNGIQSVRDAANAGADIPGTGLQGPPDTPPADKADTISQAITTGLDVSNGMPKDKKKCP